MIKQITLACGVTTAAIYQPDQEAKVAVQQILTYHVKGYENTFAFSQGTWDGTSTFFKWSTSTFPAGFLSFVTANLKQLGYDVKIVRKPLPTPLGEEHPVLDGYIEDERYNYQYETVNRLVKYGGMVAMCATGSGKSVICELAFARIKRPTLFITTRQILMYQMKERFEKDFKMPVGIIGDQEFGLNGDPTKLGMFNVAMVQSIAARLKGADKKDTAPVAKKKNAERDQMLSILAKMEFIVLEEAHETSGSQYFEICNLCKKAQYRLALTATPFMKEDEEANMRLMAVSGPIGIHVTEKLLIDRGILAKPYFQIINLQDKPKYLRKATPWQQAYRLGIVENEERNNLIVQQALKAKHHGLSVMCLVLHKDHGRMLKTLMENVGIRVEFIFGESNRVTRQKNLNKLKSHEIDVLIGSTILDVGVDVPAVGMVILAGAGKTEVALRQRIGRGLRAKKDSPNVCFIVDFDDPWSKHTATHALMRRNVILNTAGFAEGLVEELPWSIFPERH